MKRLTAAALLLTLALTGCSGGSSGNTLSPEERTELYERAITAARDAETNEAMDVVTEADDDLAEVTFTLLGLEEGDMTAYALSVSPMNVRAYAVAAVYPAAGKEDKVLEGLRAFVESQQQSFSNYLADQYEIAVNSRLETLEDGTVLLVMSENQDQIFDAVRDVIEKGK